MVCQGLCMSYCPPTSSMRAHTSQVVLEMLPAFFLCYAHARWMVDCDFRSGEVREKSSQIGETLSPQDHAQGREVVGDGHCRRKPSEILVRWMRQMLERLCVSIFGVGKSCWR